MTKLFTNLFYEQYNNNVYSQNGEDGIIEELLKRMKIEEGWVCEFGAWDGKHFSNTFNLIQKNKNFKAVYIEGDEEKYQDLLKTVEEHPNIYPVHKNVEVEYLDVLYEKAWTLDRILYPLPIPKEFEILSIDVDSTDYHIWDQLTLYYPKIVIIEINSSVDPNNENWIQEAGHPLYETTAFRPMLNLGLQKGYKFVCHTGNMIFVRDDYFDQLGIGYEDVLENFRTNFWNPFCPFSRWSPL